MIKHRARKTGSALMASVALRGSRNMVSRFRQRLGGEISTAMASGTIPGSERPGGRTMIHRSRGKGGSALMASIALCGSRNMRTGLGFNPRSHAMTARTTARHRWAGRCMIKGRSGKTGGALMAGITLRGGGSMGRALAFSHAAIVARGTCRGG